MKMYIARDFGGGLYLFPEKPILMTDYKCWDGEDWYKIDQDLFPEVTFENSPMEVELVIKNKMIPDFLVRLTNLCTNGTINQDEYTDIYNIIIKAKQRQEQAVYKELAETLNEQYKGKLVHEHIGAYHCFGYPKFEGDTDRINMYLKPYYIYIYYEDSEKIESRFKDYNYTTLREDEMETRIQPITFDEMKELVKTFKMVDPEAIMKYFGK